MIQGVQIDLISADRLERLTALEKVRLILGKVMEGNVVVLEKGLTADEQSLLIETTMREITPDGFAGIEMETYSGGRLKATREVADCSGVSSAKRNLQAALQ